jgi:hypothetical protein
VNRFLRIKTTRMIVAASVALLPRAAFACAACYGQSDSPLAQGMNWGIMTLLGVITCVLTGVALFFVHVGRKTASLEKSATAENSTEKKP